MNPQAPAGTDGTFDGPSTRISQTRHLRQRKDGEAVRRRMLDVALRLFADNGFAATSIRTIAWEAQVNVAAIHYHFTDKAGLYGACLAEPPGDGLWDAVSVQCGGLDTTEAVRLLLARWLHSVLDQDSTIQRMRLHLRELLEPGGLWTKHVERNFTGPHAVLVAILCKHLDARADDDIHRLALSIAGLVLQVFSARKCVAALRPSLLQGGASTARWAERLHGYAMAMIEVELRRRRDEGPAGNAPR